MKAAFAALGCKVNQYENEAFSKLFKNEGYEIVAFDNVADLYIVNSCTVTSSGELKSRKMLHRARRLNPDAVTVLCGCYPQAFPDRAEAIPEADIVTGTTERLLLPELVRRFRETGERIASVKRNNRHECFENLSVDGLAGHTRAWLKIEDGCNRFCSYCIVPYARGNVRSRSLDDISREAARLHDTGYREVILVGINLSAYGIDIGASLPDAAQAVADAGIERIRFGSLEPDLLTDEMIARLAAIPQICRHFHISLQSGCEATLARMKRHYTAAEFEQVTEKLRLTFPDAAITTDIIVGFPGETDEEFAETCRFVRRIGFSSAHVFRYSRRSGTPADRMPDQVDSETKKRRARELEEILSVTSSSWLDSHIGKTVKVLFCAGLSRVVPTGMTDNNITVKLNDKIHLHNALEFVIIKEHAKDYCIGELCKNQEVNV